jgi:3-isopropylmalate/(R)-2-methylmalate dehydratase small subunit
MIQETTMEKIDIIKSTAVLVPMANIDTDQIVPARFLKTTSRDGFGEKLFYDWRFDSEGNPITNPLDGQRGSILVVGENFGCGSSREHAAWAIHDAGYKAVVSTSFADIFKGNALNNCLLPVTVSAEFFSALTEAIRANPSLEIRIDLDAQIISAEGVGEETFPIVGYKKECMLNGYTDIDYLLTGVQDIIDYESRRA